tara:strand:- start:97 stop:507 length:411 start_codon:yes stop_codon:yes gene_type:complete
MSSKPAGDRLLEVILGLIMLAPALCLWGGLVLVLLKDKFDIEYWPVYSLVILCAFWFSRLSFRLVFNQRRKDGGLFSPLAIKAWIVFFIVMIPIALLMQFLDGSVYLAPAAFLGFCVFVGIFLTSKYKRKSNESKT